MKQKETDEFKIEKLHYKHSLLEFDCGDDEINKYFSERSFEDVKNKNVQVYVFLKKKEIIGFYAISTKSVRFSNDEGEEEYSWPVLLIGQLGVNKPFQNQGWGPLIINKATKKGKMISMEVGCKGLIIETYKENLVKGFYKKIGFKIVREDMIKDHGKRYTLFYKFPS